MAASVARVEMGGGPTGVADGDREGKGPTDVVGRDGERGGLAGIAACGVDGADPSDIIACGGDGGGSTDFVVRGREEGGEAVWRCILFCALCSIVSDHMVIELAQPNQTKVMNMPRACPMMIF